MVHVGPIRQWETYWADLEPAVGSEQGGDRRPVLVVSNDGFNQRFDVVTVVPLTKLEGKLRKPYAFEVVLPAQSAGNPVDSIAMPQQVRTISKKRVLELMGVLRDETLRRSVEDGLLDHFGIALDDEL